jgi:hypothetical protein
MQSIWLYALNKERKVSLMKKMEQVITNCEMCPNGTPSKVYTADSFDEVRKVHCSVLKKDVHKYLDWNETATIPKECPLEDTAPSLYTEEEIRKAVDSTIFTQTSFGYGRKQIIKVLTINLAGKADMELVYRIANKECDSYGIR